MKLSDVIRQAEIDETAALEYAQDILDDSINNPHRDAVAHLLDRGDRAVHRLASLEREACTGTCCLPVHERRVTHVGKRR
jgi:hypothetical protein